MDRAIASDFLSESQPPLAFEQQFESIESLEGALDSAEQQLPPDHVSAFSVDSQRAQQIAGSLVSESPQHLSRELQITIWQRSAVSAPQHFSIHARHSSIVVNGQSPNSSFDGAAGASIISDRRMRRIIDSPFYTGQPPDY